jgi:hypothetical protein
MYKIYIYILTLYRRRWEDNIKTDLQEVWYVGMDWIELAKNRAR